MKVPTMQKQVSLALKAEHIPLVEIMILDTPENKKLIDEAIATKNKIKELEKQSLNFIKLARETPIVMVREK
jgi:hypothetical protein